MVPRAANAFQILLALAAFGAVHGNDIPRQLPALTQPIFARKHWGKKSSEGGLAAAVVSSTSSKGGKKSQSSNDCIAVQSSLSESGSSGKKGKSGKRSSSAKRGKGKRGGKGSVLCEDTVSPSLSPSPSVGPSVVGPTSSPIVSTLMPTFPEGAPTPMSETAAPSLAPTSAGSQSPTALGDTSLPTMADTFSPSSIDMLLTNEPTLLVGTPGPSSATDLPTLVSTGTDSPSVGDDGSSSPTNDSQTTDSPTAVPGRTPSPTQSLTELPTAVSTGTLSPTAEFNTTEEPTGPPNTFVPTITASPTSSPSVSQVPTISSTGTATPTASSSGSPPPTLISTGTSAPTVLSAGSQSPTGVTTGTAEPTVSTTVTLPPSTITSDTEAPTENPTEAPTLPLTASPTNQPTAAPTAQLTETPTAVPSMESTTVEETPSPTVPVRQGNQVDASSFNLLYELSANRDPTTAEFLEARTITFQYLDEFFASQYALNFETDYLASQASMRDETLNPVQGTIDVAVIVTEGSRLPSTVDLDRLILAAFNPPSVQALLDALQELPSDNAFSSTTGVVYTPILERTAAQSGAGDYVLVGTASGGALLILIVASVFFVRKRHNRRKTLYRPVTKGLESGGGNPFDDDVDQGNNKFAPIDADEEMSYTFSHRSSSLSSGSGSYFGSSTSMPDRLQPVAMPGNGSGNLMSFMDTEQASENKSRRTKATLFSDESGRSRLTL